MDVRKTRREDLPAAAALYEQSRRFMAEHDNPDQWGTLWPPLNVLEEDIENGCSYVCEEEGEILAVFLFVPGPDPYYEELDTEWLNDRPYHVVHRLATGGNRRGAGAFCLNWCFERCGNLRIDTHEANLPMRRLLLKLGFQPCGITQADDGTPRLAFQKSKL